MCAVIRDFTIDDQRSYIPRPLKAMERRNTGEEYEENVAGHEESESEDGADNNLAGAVPTDNDTNDVQNPTTTNPSPFRTTSTVRTQTNVS